MNPELQVDVKLNDSDYQRGAQRIQGSIKQMAADFRTVGREISEVSRTLTFFGAGVTASIGATFSKASKDMPVLDSQLKDISNSFQALADNVATAAAPSLTAFSQLLNGTVAVLSRFVVEHQQFVNQFIQYSGIAFAVGTVGFAISKLIKTFADLIRLGANLVGFFASLLNPITLVVGLVLGLVAAVGWLSDKFLGTHWIDDVINLFKKLGSTVQSYFGTFQQGTKETTERSIDMRGKFSKGFKDQIKSIGDAMADFGAGVEQALDKAFGDTIFNAITGKLNGLRSLINSLGNDAARAFSKFASNEIMAGIFGDKDNQTKGLLGAGGLGSMLHGLLHPGQKPGAGSDAAESAKKVSHQFNSLTDNMKKFGRAKDDVIDNLKRFSRQLQNMGGGGGGNMAGGGGMSLDVSGMGNMKALNESLAGTAGLVAMIQGGFNAVSQSIVKIGVTYAVVQATMLGISAVSSAVMVAIGTAAASALAAVWAVPAILASIATLGGAAAIGTAAVAGAVAAAPGIGAIGSGGGAGGGFDLPKGAGISFGGNAFGGEGIPHFAEGGIVSRPTLALIGESGPEAVVPLSGGKGSKMGGTHVEIHINEAILNSPSNMRSFVNMLKEELAR